jgi:2-keto-4-pentenoate hydratase/2-oxohepta-3-ene-1,7-dioic acid hydratase in catechol pathway
MTRPGKIVCVGRNYVAHARELGNEVPERPLLFLKPPSAVIGDGTAVELPPESTQVEYEGEIGVVVGRRSRASATRRAGRCAAWRAQRRHRARPAAHRRPVDRAQGLRHRSAR